MKDFSIISKFFIVGVRDFVWSKDLEVFLKTFPIGGIGLFNSPYESPLNIWSDRDASLEAVFEFQLKALARVKFLAVDQEGGRVRRLRGAFVPLPSAQKSTEQIDSTDTFAMSDLEKLWKLAARQMFETGIRVNWAPVCDLRTADSHSGVIGDRSFGERLEKVFPYLSLFCRSFEGEGVRTCLKHFPGHGPTQFDSHDQVALIKKPQSEYLKEDFEIFQKLAPLSSAILTAHIAFEEEPDRILSLDPTLLNRFRQRLAGNHLAWMTDDLLVMKAVQKLNPWLRALDCEYDFILLCDTLDTAARAIEESIRYVESKTQSFSDEEALMRRLNRSQSFFDQPKAAPSSHQTWKKRILELESQALTLLEKLKLAESTSST